MEAIVPTPSSTLSSRLIAQEEAFGAHNYHPLEVVLTRGQGAWVEDVDGKRYLDFLSAYSAVNQGHCHPTIVAALVDQGLRLSLTSRAFRNDRLPPLLEQLSHLTGFPKALLMNSGAEAVETAIKAARKWAYEFKQVPYGQAEILAFHGNFHGRTTTLVGFSDDPDSHQGYAPATPGFRLVPYGDLGAVEASLSPNTAAVLVEPIQGEGGVILPPEGFLRGLRRLCDQHRVLLIADEIQSGLGRTGRLFAFEHEGIRPDGVTLGKALSGGLYPVSAFLATEELMSVFTPGVHGSTYGGNPLACAVTSAALKVLVEEGLVERAERLGRRMEERLLALRSPRIRAIRVKGLWAGVDFHPEAGPARRYVLALQKRGILCKDTHGQTLRLAPPLVIEEYDLEHALNQLEAVLED